MQIRVTRKTKVFIYVHKFGEPYYYRTGVYEGSINTKNKNPLELEEVKTKISHYTDGKPYDITWRISYRRYLYTVNANELASLITRSEIILNV